MTQEEAVAIYVDPSISVSEAVELTGYSQRSLSRFAGEIGKVRPTKGGSRPLKYERNIEQVLALAKEGLTVDAITESLPEKVNPRTVGSWINQNGLVAKYRPDENRRPVQSLRDAQRVELLRLVQDGIPVSEAAQSIGVNKTSAYRWVKAEGVALPDDAKRTSARSESRRTEAVRLYSEGLPLSEIRKALRCDYYVLGELLRSAGIAVEESDRKVDVLDGQECPCGQMTGSMNALYCSPTCRNRFGRKRQPDPTKRVTFNCQTCGKETTRLKSYGNGNPKFCSNACAAKHTKAVRHYVVRESDMVLDSTWEMLFAGILGFLKIPVERYDRTLAVEYTPDHWYAPDFWLPTLGVAVEVKGQADTEDPTRWAHHRTTVGPLVVIDDDRMNLLRAATAEEALDLLGGDPRNETAGGCCACQERPDET